MTDQTPISVATARPAATPMIEQFLEIKAANPDCLLFYRMGDFYELFFEDAVVAAGALGITLTRRGKHLGDDIAMCGVPVHAADDYLARLIAKGHRVAVCEQIEDPAEARRRGGKSVVRRDVVRLVTPGTITEERLLEPCRANYLMALGRIRGEEALALAWIDISTGAFRVVSTGKPSLHADVCRIEPSELIVSEAVFHDTSLRPTLEAIGAIVMPQPASLFDSASAAERIARYFGVGALDGFGSFSRAELSAMAGAIAYVQKTQRTERPPLRRPERESDGSAMAIDPATRAHLELARTLAGEREGSLVHAVDRTATAAGARLLAERLMSPLTDPTTIAARLDSVSCFAADPRLRDAIRESLKAAPDMPRSLSRLALDRGGPRDLACLAEGMGAARNVAARLEGRVLPSELQTALASLIALPDALAARLVSTLAGALPLLKREGGFVRAGCEAMLDEARALRDESRRVILSMEADFIAETGVRSLKIRHNAMLGYYIEVNASHRDALSSARFIHRQTMANAMRFTTAELAELETKIANAAGRALQIELAIFDELVAEAVAHAEAIQRAAAALAVIDVASALADFALREGWVRPVVDRSLAFRVSGGRHPVVELALKRSGSRFIANDCDLSPPESSATAGAIWLLTGPNMGGKSTFLRQNAVIAILAQAGSFVPATAAHIGVVDRLFSRVGASDDLARGRSTFMVEMVETAAILNQAGERSLVILDEIGRGTATFDGLSIAWASLEHLHDRNGCRAIFATHFHEMTALAGRLARLSNVTMRVKEWEGDVIFLHEVARGAADRSYGVQVARLAGLPKEVVERARQVLAELEAHGGGQARLIDDLPLFSAALRREPEPARVDAAGQLLATLNPDEMTPREALDALYRLKHAASR